MSRHNTIFLLLQIILISLIQFVTSSQPPQIHFTGGKCLSSDNFTINSTYHTNLRSVFSKLTAQSAHTRFSNISSGTGPGRVNGLFLCRPDLSLETCQTCVTDSVEAFLENCAIKKEAIVWYEECMLRYSNRSIFSTEEIGPLVSFQWSIFNVSRPDLFPSLLNDTMEALIVEAASVNNTLRFATGKANFTTFEGLYGLVMCTPDLTGSECEDCLRRALMEIPICCGGLAEYTIVDLPSCQLRYDTAPFFFAPPPSPPPPPLAPSLSPSAD